MEGVKKYGDLSDAELLSFLHEIEDGDDVMQEQQEESSANVAYIEQLDEDSLPEEISDDKAWEFVRRWAKDETTGRWSITHYDVCIKSEGVERRARQQKIRQQKGVAAFKEKCRLKRIQKIDIQRKAFNQDDVSMSRRITKHEMQLLIATLTKDYAVIMNRCTDFINRRLGKLLRPFIPIAVKNCYDKHRDSMKDNPGFMYVASTDYGGGKSFWATPDLPYYFPQGSEKTVLLREKSRFLFSIDKAVAEFDAARSKQAEMEMKYASKLVQMKQGTFYDLLKLNPFWFEILYTEITHKKLLDEQS